MIDIHSHILPGIDDGAKTIQDTRNMLKMAIAEGVTTIVATPHYNPQYKNERDLILEKVVLVQDMVKKEKLPISVVSGQEVRVYGDLIKDYISGKLATVADFTRFMLVEFPSNQVPSYASRLFYEMTLEGFQPILVHPERNSGIIEDLQLLADFVSQGVITQVTASSITGHFGRKVKEISNDILDNQLAHFIASDAHNITSRAFKMKDAFQIIEKNYGQETVDYFNYNAEQVIVNGTIDFNPPAKKAKKKLFGKF
ncbi:MAG: tyrosine-protein phosphatase [Lactovum sp.]